MLAFLLYVFAVILVLLAGVMVWRGHPRSDLPGPLRQRLRLEPESGTEAESAEDVDDGKRSMAIPEGIVETWQFRFIDWLALADLQARPFLLRSLGLDLLISLLLGLFLLPVVGVLYFLFLHPLLTAFWIRRNIQKRAAQALIVLPAFLDSVVRISRTGSSLTSAIQSAAHDSEGAIRDIFRQILRREKTGVTIDRAMLQVSKRYRLPELAILASVLRLNQRYGGRTDLVLERLADWLRGRVSVQAELRAMSAETRFSALILSVLIPGLGAYIAVMNSKPLLMMWATDLGRFLLILGVGLIMLGVLLVLRMSKI